jgi:hypothetical protein
MKSLPDKHWIAANRNRTDKSPAQSKEATRKQHEVKHMRKAQGTEPQPKRGLTPFGKEIKKRLIDLDMKQRDLARLIGTSNPFITYIMYGDRSTEKWEKAIRTALDMPRVGQRDEGA